MAEFSYLWTTTDTGPTGDQVANYTQTHWAQITKILAACMNKEGVAQDYGNQCNGTVTGANTVQIGTGVALVDGKPYLNSAAVDVNIPSAVGGGNTRYDRIVLRANWSAFTVRIYRIAGVDAGSPAIPSITQTPGDTYDIPLFVALVDTSGAVTLTAERQFASPFQWRQGGSATDWSLYGAVNRSVGNFMMQAGAYYDGESINVGAIHSVEITFPEAFAYPPLVFVSYYSGNDYLAYEVFPQADTVTVTFYNVGASAAEPVISWLAIGPKS